MREVKIVDEFEDCDHEYKIDPTLRLDIPHSTPTGKAVLREVAQGNPVEVSFDDGDHTDTKNYLKAMCEEYYLPLEIESDHKWNISPEPQVRIVAKGKDP